jgi:hypothetical protein
MNEMKRRVAALLQYISRTQIEMAGEHTSLGKNGLDKGSKASTDVLPTITVNGDKKMMEDSTNERELKDAHFKDMTSMEMMDVLTRKLVLWQQEFGKYGEK